MTNLTKINVFDANYYRLNVESARDYRGAELGTIATSPLIHTYNASFESTSPRLTLRQDALAIQVDHKNYQVKRFLAVQCLNGSFINDEEGNFRPTVKPHYAISPVNGSGTIYNEQCKTLLTDGDGILVYNNALPVHVHDGLLSPAATIQPLNKQLIHAQKKNQSKFYISYVVDDKNCQILVTQHCLLNEGDHLLLCKTLDSMSLPTLEKLCAAETSIKDALARFKQTVTRNDISIQTVTTGISCAVPQSEILQLPTPLLSGANSELPPLLSDNKTNTPSKHDSISASFVIKALCSIVIVVSFLALALFTCGVAIAIAGAAYGSAAVYAGGVLAGGTLAQLGFFGLRSVSEPDEEIDLNDSPSIL